LVFISTLSVPDVSTHFLLCFVGVWPTRESFGMARGPRFWALGVDSGLRGEAFEGLLEPQSDKTYIYIYIFLLVPKRRLRLPPKERPYMWYAAAVRTDPNIGPKLPMPSAWDRSFVHSHRVPAQTGPKPVPRVIKTGSPGHQRPETSVSDHQQQQQQQQQQHRVPAQTGPKTGLPGHQASCV
jgi:hypothetical protein